MRRTSGSTSGVGPCARNGATSSSTKRETDANPAIRRHVALLMLLRNFRTFIHHAHHLGAGVLEPNLAGN